MKKTYKKIVVLFWVCVLFASNIFGCKANKGSSEVSQKSKGYSTEESRVIGEFTAKTTMKFLSGKKKNTCYSPISLFAGLTLLSEVTEENTKEELLSAMGVNSIEELEDFYQKYFSSVTVGGIEQEPESSEDKVFGEPIDKSVPTKISLNNSLWLDKSFIDEGSSKIIEECEKTLNCEIFEVDKINADDVNDWVTEKTNNLISEMFDELQCSLVLVNTLYYRASWLTAFEEVGEDKFELEDGKEIDVTYMKVEDEDMKFLEADDYTSVSVPLKDGNMILVLPEGKVESLLTTDNLNNIISASTNGELLDGEVTIQMPGFTIESSYKGEMEDTLKAIGINELFSNSNWAISDKIDKQAVDMQQDVKIVVNETGIEAAAATSANATYGVEGDKKHLDITFNRPFLYVLMKDDVPLFIGTVYNPAE